MFAGDFLNFRFASEYIMNRIWNTAKRIGQRAFEVVVNRSAGAPDEEREQAEGHELGRVSFCGSDADFRSGLGIKHGIAFTRQRTPLHVADRKNLAAPLSRKPDGGQRIGGFARLRNGDDQRTRFQARVAIPELAGEICFHRDIGEIFQQQLAVHPRMIGRAARDDHDARKVFEVVGRQGESGQLDPAVCIQVFVQ